MISPRMKVPEMKPTQNPFMQFTLDYFLFFSNTWSCPVFNPYAGSICIIMCYSICIIMCHYEEKNTNIFLHKTWQKSIVRHSHNKELVVNFGFNLHHSELTNWSLFSSRLYYYSSLLFWLLFIIIATSCYRPTTFQFWWLLSISRR